MATKAGSRLVCGRHAVKAALLNGKLLEMKALAGRNQDLVDKAKKLGVRAEFVSASELARLASTDKHQGLVGICSPENRTGWQPTVEGVEDALVVVADGVQDPRNLGSCLRSLAAMGGQALICPKRNSAGLTATTSKAASGALEHVVLDPVANLARELRRMREMGFFVMAAEASGDIDVHAVRQTGPIAMVLGGEASGIRPVVRKECDISVKIPLPGGKNVSSLNVAVACGICLAAIVSMRARMP